MGIKQLAGAALGVSTLSETPPETPAGDFSANVTPPRRTDTIRNPFALPAFYRGVVLIVNMAAPMTINAWRGDLLVNNPLVAQPDPWMTRRRFFARTVFALVMRGNAYWRILRNAEGTLTGLRVATRGRAYRDQNGAVRYQLAIDNKIVDLPAREVEHLRFLEVDDLDGLGPVQACRASLEGIAAVREYADQWFDSPDQPSGVLTTDQRLLPEEAKAYKTTWYARDPEADPPSGPSLRVLGAGLTYQPYFLNPKDAQWIEAQSWGVLDIARLLGLPGDYLLAAVEGSSLTYSNLEMIDTSLIKRTVLPDYLRPIEEALTGLIQRGQEARFDLADFLRPDAKTRADIDGIYIDKGVYDAGYVRSRDRIPETAAPAPAASAGASSEPAGDPA